MLVEDSVAVSVTFVVVVVVAVVVVVVVAVVVTVPSFIASDVQEVRAAALIQVTTARMTAIIFFLIISYSNAACAAILIDFIDLFDVKTQHTSIPSVRNIFAILFCPDIKKQTANTGGIFCNKLKDFQIK